MLIYQMLIYYVLFCEKGNNIQELLDTDINLHQELTLGSNSWYSVTWKESHLTKKGRLMEEKPGRRPKKAETLTYYLKHNCDTKSKMAIYWAENVRISNFNKKT